jgi:hypothetical protein
MLEPYKGYKPKARWEQVLLVITFAIARVLFAIALGLYSLAQLMS